MAPTVVWLRQDLRLADNPALLRAAEMGAVVPVYVWDPAGEGDWPPGAARRWWLHQALAALAADLEAMGSRLVLRCGDSLAELRAVLAATGAGALHFSTRYEPAVRRRDEELTAALQAEATILVVENRLGAIGQARMLVAYASAKGLRGGVWLNERVPQDEAVRQATREGVDACGWPLWADQRAGERAPKLLDAGGRFCNALL